MKIIVVGDTHGRSFWKLIATQSFDKFVFIGDYWDSFDIPFQTQYDNFKEIIKFKEVNPDKVVLLLGNHDYHYLPVAQYYGEKYSGFQKQHRYEIGHTLQANKSLFKMAYLHQDKYLFTHAGVTNTWLNWAVEKSEIGHQFYPIDDLINDIFSYKPHLFKFNGNDPCGDDVTQSPIWVRPQSLNEDSLDYIHVVGHTGQKRIAVEPTKFLNKGSGLFIDTLGSSGEYLIIEDGEIKIGSVFSKAANTSYNP